MNPKSDWWVVVYTELFDRAAAFVLFDLYDNFLLSELSPTMVDCIGGLDLERVLSNSKNSEELRRLMTIIGETRFTDLSN